MAMEKVFPLRFPRRGYNIVLVGAGGTGGYLANYLAKSISLINGSRQRHNHTLTIVDGDTVENKNITRQNFIPADVGKNKAAVLAERYGNAYGIEILYVPNLVTTKSKLRQVFKYAQNHVKEKNISNSSATRRPGNRFYNSDAPMVPMLVGCVDSNKTRAGAFNEWFFSEEDALWVDCGNEKTNGQTVLGVRAPEIVGWKNEVELLTKLKTYKELMKNGQQHRAQLVFNTPTVTQLHPDILDKADTEGSSVTLSCVDLAIVDPQTMRANLHAATLAYHYIDDMLFSREVTSHAVYFSTNGSTAPKLNTFSALKEFN